VHDLHCEGSVQYHQCHQHHGPCHDRLVPLPRVALPLLWQRQAVVRAIASLVVVRLHHPEPRVWLRQVRDSL